MLNKKEITKTIFKSLLIGGAIIISANDPHFFMRVLPKIIKNLSYKINSAKKKKEFYDTFYRLKKRDMIKFEYRGKQIHVSLTKEGKKEAGKYQIDDLKIQKPERWDKKWRILIFDIKTKDNVKREYLRGKIKELGLFQLQKSVWVYPYDFQKEANVLRNFFNLDQTEIKIITACEIENDQNMRAFFKLI